MQQVDAALVELLSSLFGAPELRRLLQRETWGVKLVLGITSSEQTAPNDWFHDLVVAVNQRGLRAELRALMLREREKRAAEIRAVLPDVDPARVGPRAAEVAVAPRAVVTPPRPKPAPADARPAPQGWNPVRVLHLSDLHFSAKTAWDSDTVLGRLAADVARLRGEVGEIDLVVVTGDIANHGTAEEYTQATAWLTGPLAQAAGVEAAQIRVVPGNHDVHRGSITKAASALARGLLADDDLQQAIAEVLEDASARAPLLTRQAAYLTFAQTFHAVLIAPWWSERHEIRGLTVHVAGFNSAWLSASDADRGKLLLSRWQCHQVLAGADDADLSIALMHHPWDYLHDHDQQVVEEEIRRRCGVILHGHLHQQKARLASDPDRDVLQLAAGAAYAGSKWANAYQLLELDPMRGEARAHFRVWDGHDWIPDRNRYQKAPDGVATLPLRRSPYAPAPPPTPAPGNEEQDGDDDTDEAPISPEQLASYLALVRERVAAMPWLSRQLGLSKSLSEVCVRVEVNQEDRAMSVWHGTRRLEHIPLIDVLGPARARWVLLGEPGSGKSTLLRRLALDLGGQRAWLPVLLHAGELSQHGSLLAAVGAVWGKNAAAITSACPSTRLVVLVDGLDEVGKPRDVQRTMLALSADLGAATLIVAGRPEGYPQPWPGFSKLQILPLADGEQERLFTNLGVPAHLISSQLPRLRRDSRLREIAARPLLLTLAALVLINDGALPDKRVKLYERALDCLLHRGELNPDAPEDVVRAPDDVLAALRYLAPALLLQGEGPWPKEVCINLLRENEPLMRRLAHNWPTDTATTFLDETARTVGLLVPQDRGRKFGFAHRTFGEYLTSLTLVTSAEARRTAVSAGLTAPAAWAEVLALMVAQLPSKRANTIVDKLLSGGPPIRPLLLRVLASAEGLNPETVRQVLKLKEGGAEEQLKARQKVIEDVPALVTDLAVAVGLLEQIARSTTCGHDLFWVREVLRRIERGAVDGGVLDGTVEDAKRAAKEAADNVLSHLDSGKHVELLAMLKPWWREIPAGSFDMGSNEDDDEMPVHRVNFTSGFQMLGVPVTWAMYRLFDPGYDYGGWFTGTFIGIKHEFDSHGAPPLPSPDSLSDKPVFGVSWYAAVMFAEWVGARLPLEAEWEYACRAGTKTRFWSGDTDQDLARVGWILQNSDLELHPVAQKPANAWGLHDVHGNIMEWCADIYHGIYDGKAISGSSKGYAHRKDGVTVDPRPFSLAVGYNGPRVMRNGSWFNGPKFARSASRFPSEPSSFVGNLGFRLLLPTTERP